MLSLESAACWKSEACRLTQAVGCARDLQDGRPPCVVGGPLMGPLCLGVGAVTWGRADVFLGGGALLGAVFGKAQPTGGEALLMQFRA